MRLLFLSNTRGNTLPEVVNIASAWLGGEKRVGYIPSATDSERKYFKEVEDWFGSINFGIKLEYLEIYDGTEWMSEQLEKYDGLFISGGNTYTLLKGLRDSGMGECIKNIARETEKPIIGVSAGGIVLTPDITSARAENEVGLSDFSGLSLVKFGFYPHYNKDAEGDNEIRGYLNKKVTDEVFAATDVSGLITEKDKITPLGEVYRFEYSDLNPETFTAPRFVEGH